MAEQLRTLTIQVAADTGDAQNDFRNLTLTTRDSTDKLRKMLTSYGHVVGDITKKSQNQIKTARAAVTENNKLNRVYNSLTADLKRQIAAVEGLTLSQQQQNNVNRLGANATEEQKEQVRLLTTELFNQKQAAANLAAETERKARADKEAAAAQERATAAARKAEGQYDNLVSSLKQQLRALDQTAEEQAVYANTSQIASTATNQQLQVVEQLTRQLYQQSTATETAQGSMRKFRGVMQSAGYQFQDVVVQLQSGTNAFTVFSQQGSQFASAFGPTGAIVGAAIALAGVLGASLLPTLFDTGEEVEELTKKMQKLVETTTLTAEQAEFLSNQEKESIKTTQDRIKELDKLIADEQRVISNSKLTIKSTKEGSDSYKIFTANIQDHTDKLNNLVAEQQVLNSEVDASNEKMALYASLVGDDATVATVRERKATEDQIDALVEQHAMLLLTERDYAIRIANSNNATKAQRDEINTQYDLIEAAQKRKDAEDEAIRLAEERVKENKRISDTFQQSLKSDETVLLETYQRRDEAIKASVDSEIEQQRLLLASKEQHEQAMMQLDLERVLVAGQMFGSLAQLAGAYAGEQSAIYQSMAFASRAFTLFNVYMNSAKAVSEAMAQPWPAPLWAVPMALAKTGALQATVEAIAVPAFDRGGYIPHGKQGVVAEYGNELVNGVLVNGPARVTSRVETEKILSERGGNSANINFNISAADAAGFDRLLVERRGLIHNLVKQAMNDKGKPL